MENSNELNKSLDKRGKIYRLNPFLDGDEVIHVGGRLEQSFLNNECKHPMLLPKIGKIKLAGHSGRGITLNEIRSSGYWIVDANSVVKNILYNCVECHRHRKIRGTKNGKFTFPQVERECAFHSLWNRHVWTHCSQAKKK